MKLRTHRHKIHFPIFSKFVIHVIFTSDPKTEGVRLNCDLQEDSIAWTISGEESAVHIVLPHSPDPETIAHESFHAIWSLMKFAGAQLEEEVVAYHLGHVVGCITKWSKRNAA